MAETLSGMRVAILADNGFEEAELFEPRRALEDAGAETFIVSPAGESVRAWRENDWGEDHRVDIPLNDAHAGDFDALLLPGGVMNPDKLRINPQAVEFVRQFVDADKPIAAICHGPWTLVEAGAVRGRSLTSWPSLRTDITNAGGLWSDREVVVDSGLVTSRKPADIPAFNARMIEEFAEGSHGARRHLAAAA